MNVEKFFKHFAEKKVLVCLKGLTGGPFEQTMALARRSELFYVILFALSTQCKNDLIHFTFPNGRQLGYSESVLSHCQLCPVKLSTKLCMGTFGRGPP